MALIFRTRKSNETYLKVFMIIFCILDLLITVSLCLQRLGASDFPGMWKMIGIGLIFFVFVGLIFVFNMIGIHLSYRPSKNVSPEEIEAGRIKLFGERKPRE